MYAQQLEQKKRSDLAALHYLAAGATRLAINAYRKAGLFAEAVSLARARLLSADPIFADIYSAWARSAELSMRPELAAKCYLAIGQVERALSALLRVREEGCYVLGLEVCKRAGLLQHCEMIERELGVMRRGRGREREGDSERSERKSAQNAREEKQRSSDVKEEEMDVKEETEVAEEKRVTEEKDERELDVSVQSGWQKEAEKAEKEKEEKVEKEKEKDEQKQVFPADSDEMVLEMDL